MRGWHERARHLRALADADALAVVLPLADGRYLPFVEDNLGSDEAWLQGAPQYLIWAAVRERALQRRGELEIALADGTIARSVVVAPIPWNGALVGVLVALRRAADYDLQRGSPADALATLVGVELATSERRRRRLPAPGEEIVSGARMREAIALHELGRLALAGAGAVRAAPLVADILGYGIVGLWSSQDPRVLVLEAGHGYPTSAPRELDGADAPVLRSGEARAFDRSAAPWAGGAGSAIAAALPGPGPRRVLVLAAPQRTPAAEDVDIAASVAAAMTLLDAPRRQSEDGGGAAPVSPRFALATPVGPLGIASALPAPPASAGAPTAIAWRRVLPLLAVAAIAAAAGVLLVEPVAFAAAGLLVLAALWIAGR